MKKQVVVIHGGDTFNTYEEYISSLKDFEVDLESLRQKKWKSFLQDELGDDFDVIALRMPNGSNAKYLEWKLWFDKYVSLFNDEIVLVGHSLGGIFIAKYLAENKISQKIRATYLIAAPYSAEISEHAFADFDLPTSLNGFAEQGGKIFLYHSRNDTMAPFASLEKYAEMLPNAEKYVFEDRGHFLQEKFPEIVRDIKKTFT